MIRALILGASGYGGGELLRLLMNHPSVSGIAGTSRAHAGKPFSSVHPNLRGLLETPFSETPDWAWLEDCERPVVFAAMPHGEFSKQYGEMASSLGERVTVIDLSADFRIRLLDRYQRHYKTEHPIPSAVSGFVYGLCEWRRAEIVGAKRIANPGCFATALQLGLLPLTGTQGLGHVAVSAITGSSGSGMSPSDTTHHPTRAHDFRAYKPLTHQHSAEVEQLLEETGTEGLEVSFMPHSAPIVRGIFATLQFRLPSSEAGWLESRVRERFSGEPFIRLVNGSPRVASVVGSNFTDIGWADDGRFGTIMVALDNLMKGMAGQAVQNMNTSLGLDEKSGLWFPAAFPG